MSAPTSPHDRLVALDGLRGLALLGVLLSNLDGWFRTSLYDRGVVDIVASPSMADYAASLSLWLFVEGKAFALFAFLFGVGLAMQAERFGPGGRGVLVRRLCVLLVIGLFHMLLIWNGDVLTEYALVGMMIVPLLIVPARVAATLGVLALAVFVSLPAWVGDFATPDRHADQAYLAYVEGGYADRLAFGFSELGFIAELHLYSFGHTLGLMLLGVAAWKSGLVRAAARRPRRSRAASAGLITAGLAMTGFGWESPHLYLLAPLILAAGYAALLFGFASWAERRLTLAAAVGRMAFTNYLTQSVVLGFLFFGHGLALQGRVGAAAGLAIGIALWLAQAAFSVWWLKSHRFGPLEWLWRTLTYGRAQPWRRA